MHEFTHMFFLHTSMYKNKFASLHFFVSPSMVTAGWGSFAWVECAVLLRRRAPSEDHHFHVLSGEGHRVIFDGGFNDLCAPGKGPHGHETLHQAAVSELVLDGIGVIQARFLEELLKVAYERSCLALVVARGFRGVFYAGAACLLIDVAVIVGYGLLVELFASLLAGLNAAG
jgi:hypothetical protein